MQGRRVPRERYRKKERETEREKERDGERERDTFQQRGQVNASDLIMKQSAQLSSQTKAGVARERQRTGPGSMAN